MNLILLLETDFIDDERVRLKGRRARHILDVHRAEPGRELIVGALGGKIGRGRVAATGDEQVELEIALGEEPPPPLPVHVVLALPRPKFLKRCLAALTSLGVKRVDLTHSYRVEKSYWHCEQIKPESIRSACLKGLEQARDTVLPEVVLHRRLKPFVEDEITGLIEGRRALIADPNAAKACPANVSELTTLAIGPEGGWIPYETELFTKHGFEPVRLGDRILTVETALPTLIGRIAPL